MPRALCQLLLAFIAACCGMSSAASAPTNAVAPGAVNPRPKICLVLSGGAARGAAHVGVLEALEQLRIPVDCIAGTSMGAIVGGLYASGMSTHELSDALHDSELQADMANQEPRSLLTYQEKQDQIKYLLQVEFGYANGRFFFPQGIINGNDPGRILNVLTLITQPSTDFNALPIPFRAVATDIDTGEKVVLDHGDLADAMRASMSVPGIYPPVHFQGHLLVDGGLVDNLPVDVARAMGADTVIAVNIGTPLASGQSLSSVVDVSLQVIKILGNQNVALSIASLKRSDALIQPELGDITVTDFKRMGEAINIGRQDALALLASRTDLQLSPQAYAQYQAVHRREPAPPRQIDFIQVQGNERVSSRLILSRLDLRPGEFWDISTINAALRRVYDLGYFQRLDVSVVHEGGQTGLRLDVTEKAWQPNYLRFGIHIQDDFEGGSSYDLLLGYTQTEINRLGGEWRNEFEIGRTRLAYTELYQPMDYGGGFFVAPQAEYLNDTFNLFSGENRIAEYSTLYPRAGLDFGAELGRAGELRLGLSYGHVISQPRIGDPALPAYRNTLGAVQLKLGVDSFDSPGFPSSGSYLRMNGFFPRHSLGSDIDFSKLDLSAGHAFGDGVHNVLLLAEAGTSFHSPLPVYEQFSLGGFLSLAGLRQGQLRGDSVLDAHLIYAQRLGTLPTGLGNGLYVGGSLDAGNVWPSTANINPGHLQYGGSLFLGVDTVLGPLYFGTGVSEAGNTAFFLYLGIPINGATLTPSFNN